MDMESAQEIFESALPQLLAQGDDLSFALVTKTGETVSFPSKREARIAGYDEFGADSEFFVGCVNDPRQELIAASLILAE